MQTQSVENQRGEIVFRKKLVEQQIGGAPVFDDEYDGQAIQEILHDRMKKTLATMNRLREKGIPLSPYLEIGAERGQRSLVMENDLGAAGAAADISFDMLKACGDYSSIFQKSKVPLRICCDANNLPFRSDSVPFVFCYETLHHFPDPIPIVQQIHRILSPGGCFFFDEEPYKKVLHIDLYKGKKAYSKESLRASRIRKMFDLFFSKSICNEVEYGIMENHEIPIRQWRRALEVFDERETELHSVKSIRSELSNPKSYASFLLAYLIGGTVSGICRKTGDRIKGIDTIASAIVCPSCIKNGHEVTLHQTHLSFICPDCSKEFPIVDGVLFLLSYEKFEELYPDIFERVRRT